MKQDVTIDYFAPARTTLRRSESLNILLVADNHTDAPRSAEIVIYGDAGDGITRLYSEVRELPARQHEHLYFRLPENWTQAVGDAEELKLFAAVGNVTGKEKSQLLFLTD